MISTSNLDMKGWLKGLVISVLVLMPSAILIAAKEPASLAPIGIMTLLLGCTLGYAVEKYA